jgi:hypothetical protein
LTIVCEEVAGAGCQLLLLIVFPAICASIIAGSGLTNRASAGFPSWRVGGSSVEDGVRDRRVEGYVLDSAAEYTKELSV